MSLPVCVYNQVTEYYFQKTHHATVKDLVLATSSLYQVLSLRLPSYLNILSQSSLEAAFQTGGLTGMVGSIVGIVDDATAFIANTTTNVVPVDFGTNYQRELQKGRLGRVSLAAIVFWCFFKIVSV